jgi:7,8-dihydropterin-6-yl-methyl-4-(beta-D-ribofuranosyl)aminobenzene 5'-phosphate synthase
MEVETLDDVESVKITTIVDNKTLNDELQSTWGLSFFVSVTIKDRNFNILMDTSGSAPAFFHNVGRLGIKLESINAIFISHGHGDHCGVLPQVLHTVSRPVMVYVPAYRFFNVDYLQKLGGIQIVTDRATTLFPGCMSTGDLGGGVTEHSLVIQVKNRGLVILTGCSHPGVIRIIEKACEVSGVSKVYGVMGGFHISGDAAKYVADYLKEIGVQIVSPCHCTSEDAKEIIKQTLGKNYVTNGSGLLLEI